MRNDVDRFDRWAGTYDRHRLQRIVFEPVQKTLLDFANELVGHPAAILDVGCGTGRLLRSAETRFPDARLEGVDAAAGMVEQARSAQQLGGRITFRQATAEHLPFPDAQFDLVFSTMTFHHWTDQHQGAAEVSRVLKPSGRWLLADFVPTGLTRHVLGLLRMTRFRARVPLDAMLLAAGLQVVGERLVPGLGGQVPVLAIGSLKTL